MVKRTKNRKRGEGRHIYFTKDTIDRLERYLAVNFGTHYALSLTVQRAVEEFLARQGAGASDAVANNKMPKQEQSTAPAPRSILGRKNNK